MFGVKRSLVVDICEVDSEMVARYNLSGVNKLLRYDFVLASDTETNALRAEQYASAMKVLGLDANMVGHVPPAL